MAKARKLTERFCATVKVKQREELPDTLSGAILVVQPSGSKSWAVRYRHAGRTRKLTLGGYPQIGLPAARALARAALVKVARGLDPATEKARAQANSFAAAIELYLERYVRPNCRPRTEAEYARILRRAEKDLPVQIAQIGKRDVVSHLDRIADRSGTVASNRTRTALSGLFRWCVQRDIIPASPTVGLPDPLPEQSRARVLGDSEIAAIWQAAERLGYPGGRFVQLLILVPCRRTEAAALEWSEIDFDARLWRLPAARAKNNAPHDIPLSEPAIALLQACPRISERFAFTTDGARPIHNFSGIKRELDALASIEPWTFHDLRRTAATVMADKLGVAPHIVSAVLGHVRGDRVARIYNRARYLVEKQAALTAWAERVLAQQREEPRQRSNVVALETPA